MKITQTTSLFIIAFAFVGLSAIDGAMADKKPKSEKHPCAPEQIEKCFSDSKANYDSCIQYVASAPQMATSCMQSYQVNLQSCGMLQTACIGRQ